MWGRPQSPEQALVSKIILQAYRDMLATPSDDATSSVVSSIERDRAIHFLTAASGRVADWRNHLCWLLDLDGDVIAERFRMMLDGDLDMPHPASEDASNADSRARTGSRHITRVADARARWRYLKAS